MAKLVGHTCTMIKHADMCSMILLAGKASMCGCSCPPAKPSHAHGAGAADGAQNRRLKDDSRSHRNLFGYGGLCDAHAFSAKLKNVSAACCGAKGCGTGMPTRCNYDCAAVMPKFVAECTQYIRTMPDARRLDILRLSTTCENIPIRTLITAIAAANCTTKATSGAQSYHAWTSALW